MWWSRIAAGIVALALLGGCGFRPLYGTHGSTNAAEELASIRFEPIADRIGQQLHNHFLTTMNPRGRPAHPRYVMRTNVIESITSLSVRKTAFATRANLTVNADYVLAEAGTNKSVLANTSTITVSYNILSSDFATLMAEKDARARAVRELSEDIRTRLAAYFASGGAAAARSGK